MTDNTFTACIILGFAACGIAGLLGISAETLCLIGAGIAIPSLWAAVL